MAFEEGVTELMKDHLTLKEAFIIEQLQGYMDLSKNPPVWIEPVRLRLQEKEDWKRQVKNVINKCWEERSTDFEDLKITLLKELNLE